MSADLPLAELEAQALRLFQPAGEGRAWFVFHCRPRCEKKTAKICLDFGIRHYLPLRRSTPRPRKGQRRYSFDVPLFSGYMFGCCNPEERLQVLQSNLLVRTIEVIDQEQLLEELYNIYLATSRPVDLTLYPRLKRGRWVRVTGGLLEGIIGRIVARKEGFRLALNVTMLGVAVIAEVDMDQVELLDR